jgi:polyribonucleotide nucleotidyltransferase
MSEPQREVVSVGGRELIFETGAVARQAGGAVLLRDGDTLLLAVTTAAGKPTHLPYMPLTVEYRHKLAAVGRIPGSYDRREGKATTLEVLTSRLVDRSIRPFFADAWRYDTQVIVHPLSYDGEADVSALAITAAAASLAISDVPFPDPVVGVRVVRCGEETLAFPSAAQRAEADLDLVVSLSAAGIVMLEGGGREATEEQVLEAFEVAQAAAAPLLEAVARLRAAVGKPERPVPEVAVDEALRELVRTTAAPQLDGALAVQTKQARYEALDAVAEAVLEAARASTPEGEDPQARAAEARTYLEALKKERIRAGVLEGKRLGGRGPDDVRAISGRVGWLPRCHGSSLFTRGETQVVVSCTLAADRQAQRIETIDGDAVHRFLLHYNFPPYSVGEVRPIRGPGRREIGHGFLARRALEAMLPRGSEWPYTVRIESTVTESNGSSSMASVCGGSMALLDAGAPLPRPVAGVAMGLVAAEGRHVVLTDILGDEDHVGDMDFKVAGTEAGITAIQLDNKLGALPLEVMRDGLAKARAGRLHILAEMAKVIAAPRAAPPAHAPRAAQVQILPARIRDLIGPGGRIIKGIREVTGVEVDVEDDGQVLLFAPGGADLDAALAQVDDATGLPRLGQTYTGRVVSVKHFGAFVRLFQGIEGLLRDESPAVGAEVQVVVSGISERGKLELARAR